MDLRKIIHELELEKERLDEAIMALERLSSGMARRKRSIRKDGSSFPGGHDQLTTPEPATGMPAAALGK